MKTTAWKTTGLIIALAGVTTLAEAQRPGGDRMSRKDLMEKYDADGDGKLNEAERATMREEMAGKKGGNKRGGPNGEKPGAASLIEKYDADGNGELSVAELEQLMQDQKERMQERANRGNQAKGQRGERGERMSREDVMKKYDTDGDGQLSDDEREALREAMQNRRGKKQ